MVVVVVVLYNLAVTETGITNTISTQSINYRSVTFSSHLHDFSLLLVSFATSFNLCKYIFFEPSEKFDLKIDFTN